MNASVQRTGEKTMFSSGERPTTEDRNHEDRLTRIESKIDRLNEAVVQIVRLEERIITTFRRLDEFDGRLNSMSKRLHDIEVISAVRTPYFTRLDTLLTAAISAAIGVGATLFVKTFYGG